MSSLAFGVTGRPQTAGSKVAMPTAAGPRVLESGSKASREAKRTWRGDVRDAALAAMSDPSRWPPDGHAWPCDYPVRVDVVFAFARPKSHYGTGRNQWTIKASAPLEHLQDPDVSKVWRAAEDALTGVAWRDDNLIVEQRVRKVWADRFTAAEGMSIIITTLGER